MDTTTVTKICFNNVRFSDSEVNNVMVTIITKEPINIEEMKVLDRYGTEFIRNFNETEAKIRFSLARRKPTTVSIKYKTLLDKIVKFSYEVV